MTAVAGLAIRVLRADARTAERGGECEHDVAPAVERDAIVALSATLVRADWSRQPQASLDAKTNDV